MIAKLAGVVEQIEPDAAVIDVGGVGYLAFCSTRTIGRLPPPGSPARLLIETHVREDHIHLYGFIDAAERDWFRLLTTVQGVGARLGALDPVGRGAGDSSGSRFWLRTSPRWRKPRGSGRGSPRASSTNCGTRSASIAAPATSTSIALATAGEPGNGSGATADAISALENLGCRPHRSAGRNRRGGPRLGSEAGADAADQSGAARSWRDERRARRASSLRSKPSKTSPKARLRPATLDEFVGQHQLRDNLRVFIEAAKGRGEALDHVLFFGPPGLGKTTLAQIVAREMGVDFHATSGPVIQRAADLAAMLTKLQPREVLFIDEIHRLPPAVEEYLYPAMEDYQIDLIIGRGARSAVDSVSTSHPSP